MTNEWMTGWDGQFFSQRQDIFQIWNKIKYLICNDQSKVKAMPYNPPGVSLIYSYIL